MIRTIEWTDRDTVRMIDQTRLPGELILIEHADYREVAASIREMRVRGAPAIGVAAAFGLALAARQSGAATLAGLLADLDAAAAVLRATRPTAVNLFWAIDRVLEAARRAPDAAAARAGVLTAAQAVSDSEEDASRQMGEYGAALVPEGGRVLTHCNAGSLATVRHGTALAVIRAAHAQGKGIHVYVDETRPLLQGARLTAWELAQEGIPLTLIADSMAGHFMSRGQVSCVVVGADRIAANGDVANKIGTYSVAVLAKENGIPFYVAAPLSTIDLSIPSGDQIPIEERRPEEVTQIRGVAIAPEGVQVANPAFDVTPARYVGAIITERGIAYPPFGDSLRALMEAPALEEPVRAQG
jgi:methylthioribose-1-phosphate isomerase